MKKHYDAVVIGSGFGGAITASRLAQAGHSVAILERGRRWNKGDFPRTPGSMAGGFWQQGNSHGLLEYKAFKRIDVLQASGVGGGSLVYFNVHLRPSERIFRDARWPARIEPGLMTPYYELVQGMLESRPLTAPAGRDLPRRTQAFVEAARKAGKHSSLVDIAVYTGPERQHPMGGNVQSPCVYCGDCMFGCHVHAKTTLDFTYIAQAEQRYGAEVFPLHVVECIEPAGSAGYRVSFRRLNAVNPALSGMGSVTGKHVIVAAGALGSTELLLRCRDVFKTLPELGPALGHGFSGNGDFLIPGTAGMPSTIDPSEGPSITARIEHETEHDIITIEDLGLPGPLFWYLEGALPPSSRARRLMRLAATYLLRSIGLGHGRSQVSDELDAFVAGSRTARFLPYLVMGTDAADGRIRLRGDHVDVQWSHRRSRRMFAEMERVLRQLSEAAGGRYVPSPLWRWPFRKLLTAHPLGGCRLGDDPRSSVVDHRGQVWRYPGLHVTDGAIIPTALAVNPSLTIGALAERAAFWMLHEREMTSNEAAALLRDGLSPQAIRSPSLRVHGAGGP